MVVVAGPGSGLSEEPTLGCESVTLESESFPCCPPGPVTVQAQGVVEHLLVDEVEQPALDAPHGLHGCLPRGLLAFEVVAALAGVADLAAGHDVQHPVDLPVPRAGQPVADRVAGGGVDGGRAVPGREERLGREAGDVADLDQQPGAPEGPMPLRSNSPVPVATTSSVSSLPMAVRAPRPELSLLTGSSQ